MSDLTNYAEGVFRDWMSQGSSTTPPDPLYVGLHTADPTETPDGSTEVSATDYGRVSVAAGSGWDTPNHNDFSNANDLDFGEAQNDWGTLTHISLWDAETDGNCLAAYQLDNEKSIPSGDKATFPAGSVTFSFD